jgi:GT2 family glycosyltransferase
MNSLDALLPSSKPEFKISFPWTKGEPRLSGRVRVDGKFLARDNQRLRVKGVTYGPFAPNERGEPLPSLDQVMDDFARMQDAGINSIRTYHIPPEWFLNCADETGLDVFLDLPWQKHLCFLDSTEAQREARQLVRQAAKRAAHHPCVLAYSIGNEIPPSVVRWHGASRVERFLAELGDAVKQEDPQGLVTYANFPSTEYLDLSFLDFVTFNVYLHDRETFCRYLFRLHNLIGEKPLILGELGMDTLRHGQMEQAQFLAGHLTESLLMGAAGAFVFSWTDDWYTGGSPIKDWAFGITHADRLPKASYHALREVFQCPSPQLLSATPRVSVVVCTYNGGRTLEQCLRSLQVLDYPDYEVIVVDDGSTDDTRAILAKFPTVHAIHQPNEGLSVARNVGLQAATGAIVAYTDSDCFADPDWLVQLVYQFHRSGAAAVGGPNLTPPDGWLAGCVAASPGQPTHVLESDQVAEHIPGCNMAFRREALLAINGFDPVFRKAGDDVDLCWRLQQAGYWITFAPGAFVWHHRRQNPRAFLRQQAGYGEAEALLRFKHPDKFTGWGEGKWRGVLYGASLQGLRLGEAFIYRGTFGTGFFQCIYQPGPAHWARLASTLDWHLAMVGLVLLALFWPWAWVGVGLMLACSVVLACLLASQATLAPDYDGFLSRLLICGLCYSQPLVRSWWRYKTRFLAYQPPAIQEPVLDNLSRRFPFTGALTVAYWSEKGQQRTELLQGILNYLGDHRWGKVIDSGWEDWDLEIHCHLWSVVQVCTVQEDHGGDKHLIRVRYRLRTSGYTKLLAIPALLLESVALLFHAWLLAAVGGAVLALCVGAWWRGTSRAGKAVAICDQVAEGMNLIRCSPPFLPNHQLSRPHFERRSSLSKLSRWLDRLLHGRDKRGKREKC